MKQIILILVFVVSILGAANMVGVDSNSSVTNVVVDVTDKVADTIKDISKVKNLTFNMSVSYFLAMLEYKKISYEVFGIDIVKVIIAVFILLLSFLARRIISGFVYLFTHIVKRFNEKVDVDMVMNITMSLKNTIFLATIFWTSELALKIVLFPSVFPDWIHAFFMTMQAITLIILAFAIIKNAKSFYLKKPEDKRLRVEQVNFIALFAQIFVLLGLLIAVFVEYWSGTIQQITGIGIGGATIALFLFKMMDKIGDFMSATILVFNENVKQGDWVKTAYGEGTVMKIGFFETEIRAFDQSVISIPNSVLYKDGIINYDRRGVRRIKFTFTLSHEYNSEAIKNALNDIKEMISNHPDISKGINYSEQIKRVKGLSDTVLVHFTGSNQYGKQIEVYCFNNKDDWSHQVETRTDIELKIDDILKQYDMKMLSEALVLSEKIEDKGDKNG